MLSKHISHLLQASSHALQHGIAGTMNIDKAFIPYLVIMGLCSSALYSEASAVNPGKFILFITKYAVHSLLFISHWH